MIDENVMEALIDAKVEIEAIHLALEGLGVPTETVKALREEVDRKSVRDEVLKRLSE